MKNKNLGQTNVHENKNLLLQTRFISLIFNRECKGIKKIQWLRHHFYTLLTYSIHHSQAHHISVSMLLYSGFTFLDKQKMAKSGPKTRFVLTPLCVTSIQTWPPIRPAGAQWEIFRLFYPPPFQNYSILIKFLCFVLNAKTLWMVIFDSSFKKMCLVRKKDTLIFRREKKNMKNYSSLGFF